jgi:hypothetical protein
MSVERNALNYIRPLFVVIQSRSEVLMFVGYTKMLSVTEEYIASKKRISE